MLLWCTVCVTVCAVCSEWAALPVPSYFSLGVPACLRAEMRALFDHFDVYLNLSRRDRFSDFSRVVVSI
jgi:hypothetical protein